MKVKINMRIRLLHLQLNNKQLLNSNSNNRSVLIKLRLIIFNNIKKTQIYNSSNNINRTLMINSNKCNNRV